MVLAYKCRPASGRGGKSTAPTNSQVRQSWKMPKRLLMAVEDLGFCAPRLGGLGVWKGRLEPPGRR